MAQQQAERYEEPVAWWVEVSYDEASGALLDGYEEGVAVMPVGWICELCGASNAPQLLQCLCTTEIVGIGVAVPQSAADLLAAPPQTPVAPPQTTVATSPQPPQTTVATSPQPHRNPTATSPQTQLAGISSKALETSTTKNRYQYKDLAFNRFWAVYPLKRDKAEAYRKWRQVIAAGIAADRIITAAAKYAVDPSRDVDFTKYPSGWLAGGRWDDEPVEKSHPTAAVSDIDQKAQREARIAEEEAAIREMLDEDEEPERDEGDDAG